jgi:isoquinoline 1-oxidoreductase subunit alpha
MSAISLLINGKNQTVDVDPATPLLWVLRDALNLTGTKYGCGIAECGACTVHVDGVATRSCVTPVSDVKGKKITTIEGLSPDGSHPLQKAWVTAQVPQCGYCQSGFIMTAAEMLAKKRHPGDADIDTALAGHICRCGTYQRIRSAINLATKSTAGEKGGAE